MQSLVENNIQFGTEISWPKEFPELKLIDDCLRCGICYDYFKTVMVTPCAHSYCSICIRKYLTYKTACPTCFEETFETSLRNNRILDRLVELFSHIRDKLVKHLKIAAVHFNCNEKSVPPLTPSQCNSSVAGDTPKNTLKKPVTKASTSKGKLNFSTVSPSSSSSSRKSEISKRLEDILGSPVTSGPTCRNHFMSVNDPPFDDMEINIPTVPSMFLKDPQPNLNQQKTDVLLVKCPVCLVDIPERNINTHLDNCLANADKPVRSPEKRKPKRNPLPKMVWHMMAEKDLRKKLKDYGLSIQGDKRTLISRIQRYIVLYNSECDSECPRKVSEIIKQVEREEKQMPNSNTQTQQRLVLNKKSDPKIIEEENKKYIQENKDSFKKLIEAMREREGRNIKPLRPLNRLSDDDDDDESDSNKKSGRENEEIMSNKFENLPVETVNLCESRSSSPILDSTILDSKVVQSEGKSNTNDPPLSPPDSEEKASGEISSEDIFLPNTSYKSKSPEKIVNVCADTEDSASDVCDADNLFQSSPSPLSPSCIVTARSGSESEDSVSLLINQNVDDEQILDYSEQAAENGDTGQSQICDPDFVLTTEDQEQGDSEEVFVPRKSKRKHQNSSVVSEIPSPRRMRRRLNK